MRVLVTGGAGRVGLPLVERLVASGFHVRVIGRREGMAISGADYMSCDITDYPSVHEVMKGTDAVIHLAALPAPDKGPPQEVYRINCSGTFAIYQAAADLGIRRVVTASSINAVGYFFGLKEFPLSYLPIDEEHPSFATDAYSLSKIHVEALGAFFWDREGISGASLRIPGIYNSSDEQLEHFADNRKWAREYLEPKFQWDSAAKRRFAESQVEKSRRFRNQKPFEWPSRWAKMRELTAEAMDPDESRLFFSRTNFFTNLDNRDSARAFELALTKEYAGFHSLFVNDSHNCFGLSSRHLAELVYPEAKAKSALLDGTSSLVSIERARNLVGFEPEYSLSRFF